MQGILFIHVLARYVTTDNGWRSKLVLELTIVQVKFVYFCSLGFTYLQLSKCLLHWGDSQWNIWKTWCAKETFCLVIWSIPATAVQKGSRCLTSTFVSIYSDCYSYGTQRIAECGYMYPRSVTISFEKLQLLRSRWYIFGPSPLQKWTFWISVVLWRICKQILITLTFVPWDDARWWKSGGVMRGTKSMANGLATPSPRRNLATCFWVLSCQVSRDLSICLEVNVCKRIRIRTSYWTLYHINKCIELSWICISKTEILLEMFPVG